MQNITSSFSEIIDKSVYQVPYPVDTKISLVDLYDVAQVAALVLNDQTHQGAIYELVGTEAFSQQDISRILSKVLGKPIPSQQIPIAFWESRSRESGLGSYQINTLVKMFRHYQLFGFSGNTRVLSWLLGRQPTSLEDCLERELTTFRRK
jgi:uncharacterized protein YbjT (DUF2867 family)